MARRLLNFRFYERDDRVGSSSNHNIRKVSFKNNHGRIRKPEKIDKARERLISRLRFDDDIDMGGCDGFKGITYMTTRPRSPGPRKGPLRPCEWYKVKIVYGSKYEKSFLLQMLLKYLRPHAFIPVSYSIVGAHAIFFVDDMKSAQLLEGANRKLSLPDGHKMIIKVQEGRPPQIPIDNELKEKMKLAMSKRYIAENKALNLSKFVKDPEFSGDLYCPLSRPPILRAAIQIISENIPDLFALDLTGNRIQTIDEGTSLEFQKLKNLRVLHLGENNIRHFAVFNSLKDLELTELVLKDNPIVEICSDQARFVSEIRKRFPKLTKLDNVELPPVISFDVGEETKLPVPQASFICNLEGRVIVREFLSQYFTLYDSGKRADLSQAYQDNAHFSMCSFYAQSQSSASTNNRLGIYIQESRNLFKVQHYSKRRSRIHAGKEDIVQFLEKLPKTQHDLSSFVVDLTIFTPTLINLNVCGVFREPDPNSVETSWPVRHFSRTFIIVPVGQGFCIVNDSLFVTNATDEQKAAFFKVENGGAEFLQSPSASASRPVTENQDVEILPSSSSTAVAPADESVRLQMVQTLATQTGMNLEWSKKCLDETQWNFDRAVWTFTELQKQRAIPSEAFINLRVKLTHTIRRNIEIRNTLWKNWTNTHLAIGWCLKEFDLAETSMLDVRTENRRRNM